MRKLAVWFSLGMLLAWSGAFFLVKTYHDSVSEQMGSVADQLEIPEAWTVVSEHSERERFICFNDKPCPTLSRTWQADRVLGVDDILRLAETAGWEFETDGTCERAEAAVGMSSVCSAIATVDGHQIRLHIDSPEPGAASLLRLYLQSSNG